MAKFFHGSSGLDSAAKSTEQNRLQLAPRLRPTCAGITFKGRVDFVMEEWKTVLGCEGFYEVSNLGRVRAMFEGNHGQYKIGRLLKLSKNKNGYWRVELNVPNRKPFKMSVHTMVLEAFVGPRPEGQECRHLDGVRSNSNLENLAWGTHSENDQDQRRHGTRILGERHPMSKLSESQVFQIREMRKQGLTYKTIAASFGVDHTNIYCVIKGKTWTHI